MNRVMALGMVAGLLLAGGIATAQDYTGSDRDMRAVRAGELYRLGREELDESRWEAAIRAFDDVIALGGGLADGAHYWKAYALSKTVRAPEALAVLAAMGDSFPDSRWKDDARALELEIRQSAGSPISPGSADTEELKLIALNGLLHVDPDRAIPMLEKILHGSSSPRMKEQALFVLVQTGSPEARELVLQMAKGGSNPDLQLAALEHMGWFGEEANLPILKEIYASTASRDAKNAIIMSFGMAGAKAELVQVIETEQDADLRREAAMHLGHAGGGSELVRLYDRQTSFEVREAILEALAMTGESEKLEEVARSEESVALREIAVRSLGMTGRPSSQRFLVELYGELYGSEDSVPLREAILEAFMVQGAANALIDVAGTESEPELKKRAVEMLAMMDSPEATEFLLGILDE